MALPGSLTLIFAGIIMLMLRDKLNLKSINDTKTKGSNFIEIQWSDSFTCGDATIDRQHRQILDMANRIINSIISKRPRDEILMALDELADHIVQHFQDEEKIITKINHPLLDEHKILHAQLLEDLTVLKENYRTEAIHTRDLIGFIVHDIIMAHILKEDKLFMYIPTSKRLLWSKE